MPPCPIAMPSSTAIVLNSRGTPPACLTASATTWPTSRRCTWPGTNWVKLLATATIGLPKSSRATPVARSSARAPAMFLPCVTVRDLSGGIWGLSLPKFCEVGWPPVGGGKKESGAFDRTVSAARKAQRADEAPRHRWRGAARVFEHPEGSVRELAGQNLFRCRGDPVDLLGAQDLGVLTQVFLGLAARVNVH